MTINTPFTAVQIYLNHHAWRVWLIVGSSLILMGLGAARVVCWLIERSHG